MPGCAADEFVGACADRMFLEAVLTDLGHIFLRHDDTGGAGCGAVESHEVGPRLLQVEPQDQRVDNLDLPYVILEGLRPGALIALEAELDVLRRQRVAVVKFEPRPQFEFVSQAVLALLPGFGEARSHLLSGIGAHQRIMDRIEHAEGRDLRRRGRGVEPGRRNRHVPRDDRPSRGRRFGRKRCGLRSQERPQKRADKRYARSPPSRRVNQVEILR